MTARTFRVSLTRTVAAPADVVYGVFADYEVAHPQVLPPRFFVGMTVEEGGYGAGTIVLVRGWFAGKIREIRGHVTEPHPGRLLVESYPDERMTTSFLVEPGEAGSSIVTLTTEMPRRAGVLGWIEERLVRRFLSRLFREELDLVADYLSGTQGDATHG